MYVPPAFAESDLTKQHDFIEQHSFGLLVSQREEFVASHLPFLLDRTWGRNGRLIGHVARANLQWEQAQGQPVLVVFSGPHAYVSPSWYEAENVVPTWNYVAVHTYGTFHLVEDPEALAQIVQDTVERYEQPMPKPWRFDQSTEFNQRLLPMIVGFRIEIDRIEGKWKLSQNHSVERRERVVRGLLGSARPESHEVARLMQDTLAAPGA